MNNYLRTETIASDNFTHFYNGISKEELETKIHELLLARSYKLIDGSIANGAYERGNRTMRILFGAFVKYFKFSISVSVAGPEELAVNVKRTTSGISGGVVGVSQVQKELKSLEQTLQEI